LRSLSAQGDSTATRALRVTNRTSFMLSGAQLGITVTGLMVGYVAGPLVGEPLGELVSGTGITLSTAIAGATVVVLVLATVFQIIFGELFPKNLAIAAPTPLSRALARPTLLYLAAFGWLIGLFDAASNALLKLIRVEPVHDLDSSANADDLEHIVENSRDSGDIPEELFILLDRILDFPDQDVEHAMVPRAYADTLSTDASIAAARELMSKAHTRYPILDEEDNPVGVLHLADVLNCQVDDTRAVSEIMRVPIVVPTVMRLPDVLRALLESRNDMACVIDEYGGFAGIVTIEDLGEELVGEIHDEHDTQPASRILELAENTWRVPGSIPLDELERLIDHDISHGDQETLGGLLIATKGSLLAAGETISVPVNDVVADIAGGEGISREMTARVVSLARRIPAVVIISIVEKDRTNTDQNPTITGGAS
jgi:CBS domain containing-hemolysin-like protein